MSLNNTKLVQIDIDIDWGHYFGYEQISEINMSKFNVSDIDKLFRHCDGFVTREQILSEKNFTFNKVIRVNNKDKIIERIELMEKGIDYELKSFNFKKIYHDDIERRIVLVHAVFSIRNNEKNINFNEFLLGNENSFFVEQFHADREIDRNYKMNSTRIFHLVVANKDKITIKPLFVDINHQIITRKRCQNI